VYNVQQLGRSSLVPLAAKKVDVSEPKSAKEAVETGLKVFTEEKNYGEAIRLFNAAMQLKPSSEEAAAALFNLGCAYAKQRKWKEACAALKQAIDDHNLKLSVAVQDPDLRELRDTREWLDMLTQIKGGLSREAKVNLRAEAKAPFRFVRIVLFGGLTAGAGLGLIVILGRLVQSLQGGEGAPPLTESLTNLGVNAGALVVLLFLLLRDLKEKEKATKITAREESLGRLLIKLGGDRVLPLIRFRGAVRPIIVAGDRGFVERSIKAAEPQLINLRARGVSVVPVIYGDDPDDKLRALRKELKKDTSKGFGKRSSSSSSSEVREPGASGSGIGTSEVSLTEADKKWRLEPSALNEWEAWVEAQKEFAGMEQDKRNVWMQVQLDGTVRSSGAGTPPWDRFVSDLPPLDSMRTQITDGIGTSV